MTELLAALWIQGDSFQREVPRRYAQIIQRVGELHRQGKFGANIDLSKEPAIIQIGVQAWQRAFEKWQEWRNQQDANRA